MIGERELFRAGFPELDQERLWTALLAAVPANRRVHEPARVVEFRSGFSLTSWGEQMHASVAEADGSGALLIVRGRPRSRFLTTDWGEQVHARRVERRLRRRIAAALTSGERP